MESIYLKDTPFLSSPTMSIADFIGVSEVKQIQLGLRMPLTEYPKLCRWSELVRQTIGPELFDKAHRPITLVGEQVKDTNLPFSKL